MHSHPQSLFSSFAATRLKLSCMEIPSNLYGWEDKKYKPTQLEPLVLFVEYSKSNRALCVECKMPINMSELRFGQQYYNDYYLNTKYMHIDCLKKVPYYFS